MIQLDGINNIIIMITTNRSWIPEEEWDSWRSTEPNEEIRCDQQEQQIDWTEQTRLESNVMHIQVPPPSSIETGGDEEYRDRNESEQSMLLHNRTIIIEWGHLLPKMHWQHLLPHDATREYLSPSVYSNRTNIWNRFDIQIPLIQTSWTNKRTVPSP